jgi:hypothetical protein
MCPFNFGGFASNRSHGKAILGGDPSLRLKNGYARDDASLEFELQLRRRQAGKLKFPK